MVGLIYARTPPQVVQNRYPLNIKPQSLQSKRKTPGNSAILLNKRKRRKTSKALALKASNELEEAAEALLSVSPETKPQKMKDVKPSPLSFLCSIATSFSLSPTADNLSTNAKGSLASLGSNSFSRSEGSVFLGRAVPIQRKIGIYPPEARKARIIRFLKKRKERVWVKKVRYSCRKNLADGRVRVKGRFVSTKKN